MSEHAPVGENQAPRGFVRSLAESAELEAEIRKNLEGLGFDI